MPTSSSARKSTPPALDDATWKALHELHYSRWQALLARCYNPADPYYPYYGRRGVGVSPLWKDDFYRFALDIGTPPPGRPILTRTRQHEDYGPDNFRWSHLRLSPTRRAPACKRSCINAASAAEIKYLLTFPQVDVEKVLNHYQIHFRTLQRILTGESWTGVQPREFTPLPPVFAPVQYTGGRKTTRKEPKIR